MCLLGLLLIGSDGHSSSIPDCSSAIKAGQQCMQSVYDVRPTQFALGYTEVKCKMVRLCAMPRDFFITLFSRSRHEE